MATFFDSFRKVYKILVKCKNCGEVSEAAIQKGVTVRDYLLDGRCGNCGTMQLKVHDRNLMPGDKMPGDKDW